MSTIDDAQIMTNDGQSGPNGAGGATEAIGHPAIQPLVAVGVVVTKAALIQALHL